MICEPGIYSDIPMADYVSDRLREEPTVSKGSLRDIVERSPAHARLNHPRLGELSSDYSAAADIGSACHQMTLGGDAQIVWVQAKDWRTKAAQEQRDEARMAGLTPMLDADRAAVERMAINAQSALDQFRNKKFEQTIIWKENGVWCRSRPDIIADGVIVELKTCKNAEPHGWVKSTLFSQWYDVQMAHALAGMIANGITLDHCWVVVETEPPHCASIVSMDGKSLAFANSRRNAGLRLWRECLESQQWPGYTEYTSSLPTWMEFDLAARTGMVL